MTTETRSPNATAQALLETYGQTEAIAAASRLERAWDGLLSAPPPGFWDDVRTLLRLETQDDEPTPEGPTPSMPSFGWPRAE